MREGMSRNSTIVLSDSLESPTCIAWGLIHQSATLDEKIFVATLVFINKSARGNSSSIIEMADSIDIAARFYGCKATYGGEIEGHPAAGRMWEKSHFSKQETVWVKLL